MSYAFVFFNDTATTEIYTLSLHDALPIYVIEALVQQKEDKEGRLILSKKRAQYERAWGTIEKIKEEDGVVTGHVDRKSTRLNSSHANISYAVFCLKKKKQRQHDSSAQRAR